jgi:hypothetical protein
MRCVRTNAQIADVLTKHFVKREVWDALCSICCLRDSTVRKDASPSGGPKLKRLPHQIDHVPSVAILIEVRGLPRFHGWPLSESSFYTVRPLSLLNSPPAPSTSCSGALWFRGAPPSRCLQMWLQFLHRANAVLRLLKCSFLVDLNNGH